MKVFLGADHRGFQLKEKLESELLTQDYQVEDCGAIVYDYTDDYPDIAFAVAEKVKENPGSLGVLLCGSGVGMDIAANKMHGIVAAQIHTVEQAKADKIEHNSNILVFSADVCDLQTIVNAIRTWFSTSFGKGRHLRRMNKIHFMDNMRNFLIPSKPLIVPTILESDKAEAEAQMQDYLHFLPMINFDIIDPKFVEGETIDLDFVLELLAKARSQYPHTMFTVHLMEKDPAQSLYALNNLSNVYTVYIHHEANISGLASKEWSFQLGLTVNPDSNPENTDWKNYSIIQLMSIIPGAQGRDIEEYVLERPDYYRKQGFKGYIHFDGGVNGDTIERFLQVNPDVLNVGSALSKADNRRDAYTALSKKVNNFQRSK
jgi:RpiB/LacA/LacB family sugar-phosphate isomerase